MDWKSSPDSVMMFWLVYVRETLPEKPCFLPWQIGWVSGCNFPWKPNPLRWWSFPEVPQGRTSRGTSCAMESLCSSTKRGRAPSFYFATETCWNMLEQYIYINQWNGISWNGMEWNDGQIHSTNHLSWCVWFSSSCKFMIVASLRWKQQWKL